MAYTSVLPVHRLDRSIDYVKDRAKTTKSAGSLEEAIDYALNREKTEQTIFEDAMGCTCENAYVDMVKIKERFHKKDGVQGYPQYDWKQFGNRFVAEKLGLEREEYTTQISNYDNLSAVLMQ